MTDYIATSQLAHSRTHLLTYSLITQVCGDNDQDNTKENAQSNTPYMQCTEPRNDEHKHVDKKKKVES